MNFASEIWNKPAAAVPADDVVTKSLRFNRASSQKLARTFGTPTSQRKVTISWWMKLAEQGDGSTGYCGVISTGSGYQNYTVIKLDGGTTNPITFEEVASQSYKSNRTTSRAFRDMGAWMHCVHVIDTTDLTANDRSKLYINGVRYEGPFADGDGGAGVGHATYAQDFDTNWSKSGEEIGIGLDIATAGPYFGGYLADIHYIDGQALDHTYFAEEDATTGQWKPKAYSGTHGDQGFHLDFKDSSDIGNDVSGEGNDFTATNLAASDVVNDTPTDNYCTLNPLDTGGAAVLSEGNLAFSKSGANFGTCRGTLGMTSGKWYFEGTRNSDTSLSNIGILGDYDITDNGGDVSPQKGVTWDSRGYYYTDATSTSASSYSTGDTICVAFDADTKKVWFRNGSGSWEGGGDPAAGTTPSYTITTSSSAWFAGVLSETDGGWSALDFGQSGFAQTPPTGFVALSTGNLPTPTIAKPSEHFDTKIWTGDGSSSDRDITGLLFEPDLIWYKSRTDATHHCVQDDVRGWGATKIGTNSTATEDSSNFQTQYGYISASVSGSGTANGFTVAQGASGTQNMVHTNMSAKNYVAWNWKAGTTATQSGTHTYELGLELTDDSGDGWGDYESYTTPRLEVIEGTTSLGYATITYEETGTQHYTIKTNNPDAIKIVWDYDSSDGGTLGEQGVTLKNGATTMATWTTSQTVTDGAVLQAQSTSTNESTVGTLSTGAPTTYPESNYNADAGFSIAKWTGDDDSGSETAKTVNHNLGVVPEMIIAKNRTNNVSYGGDWLVYHKDLASGSYLKLNETDAETAWYTALFDSITATKVDFGSDSVAFNYLNFGGDGTGTTDADDYVAYFFASKAGYSKVGSYEGNNSADGPFVYCGFQPRWICVKRIDGIGSWIIVDTARDPYNDADAILSADTSNAESSYAATSDFDILSNGFKLRHSVTYGYANQADTYIFYAVAESPFKYANAR